MTAIFCSSFNCVASLPLWKTHVNRFKYQISIELISFYFAPKFIIQITSWFIEIPAIRIIRWTINEKIEQLMVGHPFQGIMLQLKCHSIYMEKNVIAAIGMIQNLIAIITFSDFDENVIFVGSFNVASNWSTMDKLIGWFQCKTIQNRFFDCFIYCCYLWLQTNEKKNTYLVYATTKKMKNRQNLLASDHLTSFLMQNSRSDTESERLIRISFVLNWTRNCDWAASSNCSIFVNAFT